jgi:hypothetical protein
MLSLNDRQMKLVTDAAALVLPQHRDAFLRSIALRLEGHERPSDDQLAAALTFVLSAKGVSVSPATLRPAVPPPRPIKQNRRRAYVDQTTRLR